MYQLQDETGQVYGSCVWLTCVQDAAVFTLHAKLAPPTVDSMYVITSAVCSHTAARAIVTL
jgi:hypothetical protein